jgi:hypothetical protein
MAIRKQVKDYALNSIHGLADSYIKTKNYIFNTDTQPSHKTQFITTNKRNNLFTDRKIKSNDQAQVITSMIKKQQNEEERDLIELASFIFENRMEKELGPLHNLRYTSRESKFHKPQVLKNYGKKKKKMSENNAPSNSLINNKILYSDINKIIISKQALIMGKNYDVITIEKNRIGKYL